MDYGPKFYDREGKVISTRKWARLREDPDYKVVKQENVGPYWVSTVWLGIDHGFLEGPPIIFETMVFPKGGLDPDMHVLEYDLRRYATLEEAQQGHEETCLLIRATMREEPDFEASEHNYNGGEEKA